MTSVRLALIASFCVAVGLALFQPGQQGRALSRLEGQLLDVRFLVRGAVEPPQDIVILAIDDFALEQAQAFPLPRGVIGRAVEVANDRGAGAIVLDLLLSGPTEEDAVLTRALAATQNAAIALSLTEQGPAPVPALLRQIAQNSFAIVRNPVPDGPTGILGPQPEFAEHAQLGHINLRLDDDGALRRFPVAVRYGDGPVLPGLAVVAARLQAGLAPDALSLLAGKMLILGDRTIPLDRQNMAVLNHFGPRGTFQTVSVSQVATAELKGKLVFIGATASGYSDTFDSPFDTALPGVEVLATLAANIRDQTTLRRDATTWSIGAVLVLVGGTLVAWTASRARPLSAALGSLAIWAAGLAALQLGFAAHLWLDAASVLGALTAGTVLGFVARWDTNRRRERNLSRYQSPQLVEALASRATPEFDGRVQNAAILFVDLADFTRRSAKIGSAETGKLLNRFHTLVNGAAQRWDGVVAYTAGDGAMIVFGLPQAAADDAARALSCARDLLADIGADDVIGALPHPTPVRIGAHSGDVYAAVLGDAGRATPTVTGDVVNTASRLQEAAKTQGAVMALSDAIYQAAGRPDIVGLRHGGSKTLRGRSESLDLWVLAPVQAVRPVA